MQAMHPAFQEKVAVLAALLERSKLATSDFYEKIGRPAPAPAPRFQAVNKGKAWHVVEIESGLTKGFCFSYRAALQFVDAFEEAASCKLVARL